MNLNIVTKEDLVELKQELLNEIKEIKQSGISRDKKYLRSAEMKEMLNISQGTLQNMRINGTLPYIKMGTTYLYDLDRVNEIFNENSYN